MSNLSTSKALCEVARVHCVERQAGRVAAGEAGTSTVSAWKIPAPSSPRGETLVPTHAPQTQITGRGSRHVPKKKHAASPAHIP